MTIKIKLWWQILLLIGIMGLPAKMYACTLGESGMFQQGETQYAVYSSYGENVGIVHLRPDGQWEAIAFNLGALNDSFPGPQEAAYAVCQSIDQQ